MEKIPGTRILLHIAGMTCINCSSKIEKQLKHTAGIISAEVSYQNGIADIVYDEEKISIPDMISVIEKLDYDVITKQESQTPDMIRLICMPVIIIALYVILQSLGILNLLAPSRLADTKMGYGMLFIIGLFTSVHCIAMCGGINLSQCIPQESRISESRGKMPTHHPALLYNLGRVTSYTVIGFVLGLIGTLFGGDASVGMGILLQGILKIIAGVFMIIMGLNMLELFPALRRCVIRIPLLFGGKIGVEKAKGKRPFYIGILNGFMPCGPLQSMWLVALATGNPFDGALSMFLFSLGTVPLMLGFGSAVSLLGRRFTDKVRTAGAVLVVVLGLAMLSQGGALSGWISSDLLLILLIALSIAGILLSLPTAKKAAQNLLRLAAVAIVAGAVIFYSYRSGYGGQKAQGNASVEMSDGVLVVYSTLEPGSYPDITVQAGIPVKWIIDAPEGSINGCNYKMVIQDLNLEYTFQTGENVIEFVPEKTGTIHYSCWMGMIHASIFVVDEIE